MQELYKTFKLIVRVVTIGMVIPLTLYAQAPEEIKPEENRFEKIILEQNLNEPMELAVLPDERVLFIERHGNVKLYVPGKKTEIIATIPVSTTYSPKEGEAAQEAEDGLLGLSLDPNFSDNGWIYLYYSPAVGDPRNVLARFTLEGNQLDLSTEKVLLIIPTQRDECCHTGGSIAWDANGNLYVSTGDNTSPRASDGYAPLDERPGRTAFDAQRTSGNTNDLRGKILRIHPEPDGSYTIPKGNLFEPGTLKTRPEIYTMGNRNPFRITVDRKTGYLYWGDVGPDAAKDSTGLGPRAEDEYNQAKSAGNYGWPFFVGRNRAFWDFDFETQISGGQFDAGEPINASMNNSGLRKLPPAQKPMIWYTSGESIRWPQLGSGGRSAMAGPVYHRDQFAGAERPFPSYYDNHWFIYEWMRDWIMAVHLNEDGNYIRMEPFLPNLELDHPIDMEFGPNGDLYILEYGQGWFMANPESKLVRLQYSAGNRKPIVVADANKKAGAAPLEVKLSSEGTMDYDMDPLTFQWKLLDSTDVEVASYMEANPSHRFTEAGEYRAVLKVSDPAGLTETQEIVIRVGNEPPTLELALKSKNKSFFFPGEKMSYQVKVSDREDGSLEDGGIKPGDVHVAFEYVSGENRVDASGMEANYHTKANYASGKRLIEKSDCRACHFEAKRSIGPSYFEIADKYRSQQGAAAHLAKKIISGGAGVWGEAPMAPHPAISQPEAELISQYILSLGEPKPEKPRLGARGEVTAIVTGGDIPPQGNYELSAFYTDRGHEGIPSIKETSVISLKNPTLIFAEADSTSPELMKFKTGEVNMLIVTQPNTYASFRDIDLSGINRLAIKVAAPIAQLNAVGGVIEVRTDDPDGPLIGKTDYIEPTAGAGILNGEEAPPVYTVTIDPHSESHDLYFLFINDRKQGALYVPLSVTFQPQ